MAENREIVIVDGVRTPFCRMASELADFDAVDLGVAASKALLAKTGIDSGVIDEVVFGCVAQPFDSANIARVIALRAGVPVTTPAFTVQRNCASGMEAVTTAMNKINAGRGEVFLVGGTESMSNIPLLFRHSAAQKFAALARAKGWGTRLAAMTKFRLHDFDPVVGLRLGLADKIAGMGMGDTAEILAREYGISREEQDAFANDSQHKAVAARTFFEQEITPMFPANAKNAVEEDNGVRGDSTVEKLAKLRPVFERRYGSVTAGNSSQISDGAVALLVTTAERAKSEGWDVLGTLVDYAYSGCDPKRMGLGPVGAVGKLHTVGGIRPTDCDVIEINEAFAVQVLAVMKELENAGLPVTESQLNPHGGAIALGHPVGATGARLILTTLYALKHRGGGQGIASLCIGGGQGGAVHLRSAQ